MEEYDEKYKQNPIEFPTDMRACCLICIPPVYFKTLQELQEHTREKHRVFKG